MACLNVRKATFRIFAYGEKAYDPVANLQGSLDDVHDLNQEFTASIERMNEIIAADKVIADIYAYTNHTPASSLQMWQISAILLIDVFHFSHRYLTSYVVYQLDDKEFIIKYGNAPTWLLKRVL